MLDDYVPQHMHKNRDLAGLRKLTDASRANGNDVAAWLEQQHVLKTVVILEQGPAVKMHLGWHTGP